MKIPQRPQPWRDLWNDPILREAVFKTHFTASRNPYIHWDDLRHRPAPKGSSHEASWLSIKWARLAQYKNIPLHDVSGKAFVFAAPEIVQSLLHEISMRAGGALGTNDPLVNPQMRDQYLIRNLMEEGITSSLIEGASTTREKAKEMLRSGRKPRSEGEQMVVNNYTAMQFIIDQGVKPLTPELILQLHTILTRNTMDTSAVGRFRNSDEQIDVVDPSDNEVLHQPPPADQLPRRVSQMCDFANGRTPEGFIHPIARSIILHFWLAYDHPFKDGNGRCARALFYWSMIQHGYWLCQFISISQIILRAPTQYARAFLLTETDDNDLTYFLLHQLEVVKKAMDELHRYIDQKVEQRRQLEARLHLKSSFNDRQLDLLTHALRHMNAEYHVDGYQKDNGVAYETARSDLLGLAKAGLLLNHKSGRAWVFSPPVDLEVRLDAMRRKRRR